MGCDGVYPKMSEVLYKLFGNKKQCKTKTVKKKTNLESWVEIKYMKKKIIIKYLGTKIYTLNN